ncbi:MAG: CrcB family protein [Bifidobacterium sp.]|jgi:CrcB protein
MDHSPSHAQPDIHWPLIGIVFLGGCVGTAARYAFAQIPAAGAGGYFHIGTLVANLVACLVYSGLSAFLFNASWITSGRKEYYNRGLGMGVCGGLSTMSTLGVESFLSMHGSAVFDGLVYLCVTFALGLLAAAFGAWIGSTVALIPKRDAQ